MDELKAITLAVPNDTSVLGIFYIREIEKDGYLYNSADSKVFMVPGVDGIDLTTGETFVINENDEWESTVSPVQLSDEELEKRDLLSRELEELEKESEIEENVEGAPSTSDMTEESADAGLNTDLLI